VQVPDSPGKGKIRGLNPVRPAKTCTCLFMIHQGAAPNYVAITHHPRLVEEVVDGVQCVDAVNAAVVQREYDVFIVVTGVTCMLAN